MSINDFLQQLQQSPETISFNEAIALISEHYTYNPTTFSNGLGENKVCNEAGTNEGSCKLFSFGLLHQLTQEQMLQCFGDYYRHDVLQHPKGNDHANIRNFIRSGWEGIQFDGDALIAK